jgi:hypothetical protein
VDFLAALVAAVFLGGVGVGVLLLAFRGLIFFLRAKALQLRKTLQIQTIQIFLRTSNNNSNIPHRASNNNRRLL